MTILIDTKNEMKRSVDGLDGRVSELDRELRAVFTTEITELRENSLTDLKSSQQETRTSAYNAGKRASEAVTAVANLQRDVDRLHSGLEDLRQDIGEALALLRATAPAGVGGTAGAPHADAEADADFEPEPAALPLPGQRTGPEEEAVSAVVDSSTSDEAPATADPAAPAQADSAAAAGVDAEQPAPEAEAQTGPEASPQEGEEQEAPRAALEAGDRNPGDGAPEGEPYPISESGRIWAIMRAGKVASATLVCHRDTWEFVAAQVGNHPHFRTPALEERDGGLVAAVLSGRSLVAMLLSLYRLAVTSHRAEGTEELVSYADWAMASQVYYATARVLSRAFCEEGDPVVVKIDDRVPARP
ncbi:hypothetical protein OG530_40440 [Streptomyces decoyicus]|uniref:hypothetical protein n=1 Tax=Streptomyces decoyicus TaxID=249567 RepID=UPI002E1921AB